MRFRTVQAALLLQGRAARSAGKVCSAVPVRAVGCSELIRLTQLHVVPSMLSKQY